MGKKIKKGALLDYCVQNTLAIDKIQHQMNAARGFMADQKIALDGLTSQYAILQDEYSDMAKKVNKLSEERKVINELNWKNKEDIVFLRDVIANHSEFIADLKKATIKTRSIVDEKLSTGAINTSIKLKKGERYGKQAV